MIAISSLISTAFCQPFCISPLLEPFQSLCGSQTSVIASKIKYSNSKKTNKVVILFKSTDPDFLKLHTIKNSIQKICKTHFEKSWEFKNITRDSIGYSNNGWKSAKIDVSFAFLSNLIGKCLCDVFFNRNIHISRKEIRFLWVLMVIGLIHVLYLIQR